MRILCSSCGQEKEGDEFYKNSRTFISPRKNKTGRATVCKDCIKIKTRERRKNNPEVFRNSVSRWAEENPEKRKIIRQRWAKSPKGIYATIKKRSNCDISQEEFLEWYDEQERVCKYCGINEGDAAIITKNPLSCRLNIDRKNNSIGYKKGNIVLACGQCNRVKCDVLTYEEMMDVGQNIMRPKQLKYFNPK
jgi:hypothetical protein